MTIAAILAAVAVIWFALGFGAALFVGGAIRYAEHGYDALDNSADSGGERKLNATTHGGEQ